MLSHPSSLQNHSDFPTPLTHILPVSPNLIHAYRRWSPAETLGSQVLPPLSFTACRWPYPGSLTGAHALCFPASSGLLPSIKGSARIPYRVYPFIGLSQLYPSDQMSRGCTIRFMLRPAVLAGPPDWVGHALCMPSRDRVGASSARVLPHEPALCLLIQKGN
jgi:hypothetical protein